MRASLHVYFLGIPSYVFRAACSFFRYLDTVVFSFVSRLPQQMFTSFSLYSLSVRDG